MKEKLLLIVLIWGTICTGGNAQTNKNPRNSTQTKERSQISGGAPKEIVTHKTVFAEDGFGYCSVCKEGKWGAEDLNGNIVIPCEFDTIIYNSFWKISSLISGCCFMVKKNDAYALYSREGKCIIPLSRKYKSISSLYYNVPEIGTIYSCFCENGRTQVYCNFEGKEVCKWDNDAYHAHPKYMKGVFYFDIYTKKGDSALWGIADGEGKIYVEPKYEFIDLEDDKYFRTYVNDEKKLLGSLRDIKTTNNPFIGNKFDFPKIDYTKLRKISRQTDINNRTYYIIEENNNSGIVNDKGNWIIPLGNSNSQFEKLGDIYIKYINNGFYSIVSIDGTEVIPSNRGYTNISNYNNSNNTFTFIMKGYSGTCNIQGKEISKTKLALTADEIKNNGGYASITEMKNGSSKYWKVSKGGRYGLTNADGKEIVPCEMEALESAGSSYLRYKLNGFWGLMNYQGKVLIDTDRGYTSIGDYKSFNKRFAYTMNGYKGECDATGRQISKIKVEAPKPISISSTSTSGNFKSFVSEDLKAYDLRGKVKECKWDGTFVDQNYLPILKIQGENLTNFSRDGKLQIQNYDIIRDYSGRITQLKSTVTPLYYELFYDTRGRLIQVNRTIPMLGKKIIQKNYYTYDSSDRIVSSGEDENNPYFRFEYIQTDSNGNWVKRIAKCDLGNITQTREIEYY